MGNALDFDGFCNWRRLRSRGGARSCPNWRPSWTEPSGQGSPNWLRRLILSCVGDLAAVAGAANHQAKSRDWTSCPAVPPA
jgi:hypothetical protein